MQKISNTEELQLAIQRLEQQQAEESILLKEHFYSTIEGFKPSNLINDSITEVITSSDLKTNLTKLVIGSVSGLLAKRLLVGESNKPVAKIMGTFVEMFVSKNVISNSDGIVSMGKNIFNKIMQRRSTEDSIE